MQHHDPKGTVFYEGVEQKGLSNQYEIQKVYSTLGIWRRLDGVVVLAVVVVVGGGGGSKFVSGGIMAEA